jgi:capsular exopolysaccharide synthesis family protein
MLRRVDELRSNLQESEARLQAYREQEQLIDSQGIQALPTMQINDLTGRLADAKGRLSSARIAYLQVYGDDPGPIESVPAMLENPAVQQFRRAQADAEQKVAALSQRYGPKHPAMIAAQSDLAEATENLNAQQRNVSGGIRAEYFAIQAEVRELEVELDAAKERYQVVSRKGADLAELQRQVETNSQLYDLFYNRLRETAQTSDLESVNARVAQQATVSAEPIKPRKKIAVMMALAFGLALGIGTAFLLELARNTIRSSSDVEDIIKLPLLGSVPALGSKARERAAVALFSEQERGFGEAIRTIRTGLSLPGPNQSNQVILVTSSVVGEGKSTIAMNLALAFARYERVLLIDADMRRPSIARELALDTSAPGLPELLAGHTYLNKSISLLKTYNLEVLHTGTIPSDPLELLSLGSFSKTMKTLRETYDRIIIDSPPVLAMSDAEVLSTHVDSIAYVVKFDSTTKRHIKTGLEKLERLRHHAPIAGVVLNQVDVKKAENYGDYSHGDYYEYSEAHEVDKRRRPYAAAVSI